MIVTSQFVTVTATHWQWLSHHLWYHRYSDIHHCPIYYSALFSKVISSNYLSNAHGARNSLWSIIYSWISACNQFRYLTIFKLTPNYCSWNNGQPVASVGDREFTENLIDTTEGSRRRFYNLSLEWHEPRALEQSILSPKNRSVVEFRIGMDAKSEAQRCVRKFDFPWNLMLALRIKKRLYDQFMLIMQIHLHIHHWVDWSDDTTIFIWIHRRVTVAFI